MKRIGILLALLAVLLICVPAYATSTLGLGDTVARNGELAAFMNTTGSIYISGESKPMNQTSASGILSIDAYRVVFFSKDGNLISIALDTKQETVLTKDASAACCTNDSVYYISKSNPQKLMRCDIDSGKSETVLTASESLKRVYNTSDGVIVTQIADAGAYKLDSATDRFVAYNGDIADEIRTFNTFDVYSTTDRALYVQTAGTSFGVKIDSNVLDWTVIGNNIYYLTGNSTSMTLKSYSTTNSTWSIVYVPTTQMETQLTSSESTLFMLGSDGVVYCVDVTGRRLVKFVTLPDKSTYSVGTGKKVTAFRLEGVSGQLNIYGTVSSTETLPTFTFVDSTSDTIVDTSSETVLLCAYAIDGEDTVSTLLQPAKQYTLLRRGSRGEAVSAIQEPLYDLGYYDYYIDGIFGWRTELAIKTLQSDLGLRVTGTADADLQKRILSGTLSAYDPYMQLEMGDQGLRVESMQERLRDLGYLADDADGIFGVRTQTAVELFQEENNLKTSGIATAETLKKLFSSKARDCSSYIDLRRGDSGYRVRELNERLKELYYLEGDIGSYYTSATAEAVRLFQEELGLKETGRATPSLQSKLFAGSAPEYSGYITLRRGDDNSRVEAMQRRLKKLNYFHGNCTGYFGSQTQDAVWMFERVCGLPADGVADPEMLEALYDPNAPEYEEPTKIGTPEISLTDFTTQIGLCYSLSVTMNPEGSTTAYWYADGDVAYYDVLLTDADGTVYVDETDVDPSLCYLDIPVYNLVEELEYTLTITAYPYDYAQDEPTQACIYFERFEDDPQPQPITSLIISPDGTSISYEDGVYTLGDETLTFMWIADGDVRGYAYRVTDSQSKAIIFNQEVEDVREIQFAASLLEKDEIYTLTVCAVPVDHALEDEETYAAGITFKLGTVEEETEPESETVVLPGGLDMNEPEVQESADEQSEDTTVVVTALDEGEPVIGDDITAETERSIDEEDEPVVEPITQPEVSEDEPEVEPITQPEVSEDEPVVEPITQPEASEDEPEVEPITQPEVSEDEPIVEPITQPEVSEDEPVVEPITQPEVSEDEPIVEPITQPEISEDEPVVEPITQPEEETVTVGEPALSVTPYDDIEYIAGDTEVFLVGEETLTFGWYAENAEYYTVQIVDENDAVRLEQDMEAAGAPLNGSNLDEGMLFYLNVTAHAIGDESVTSSATLLFKRPAAEPAVIEEQSEDVEEYVQPAEVYTEEDYGEYTEGEYTEDVYTDDAMTDRAYTENEYTEEEYTEEEYTEGGYTEDGYIENVYTENEYSEDDYTEEGYTEDGYIEDGYTENEYSEDDYTEEGYTENDYTEEGYTENVYTEDVYPEDDYTEDEYYEEYDDSYSEEYDSDEDMEAQMTDGNVMWAEPITAYSDSDAISSLQQRLVEWGWLSSSDCSWGSLDSATVDAVIRMQEYMNDCGYGVSICDAGDPVVDCGTLQLMFDDSIGASFAN